MTHTPVRNLMAPGPTSIAVETWREFHKEVRKVSLMLEEADAEKERKRIARDAAATKYSNASARHQGLVNQLERAEEVIRLLENQYNFEGYVTGVEDHG